MKFLEKLIEWGLYLFIFLLPWQTRLILCEGNLNGIWEYGTISLYATEILLWAVFILAAVWWTISKLKIMTLRVTTRRAESEKLETNTKYKILNTKYFIFFLAFFIFYALVSSLWADSKSVALQAWVRLAEGIGLFLVLRAVKFDAVKLAWAFIISAFLQAGLGLWQFLSQATFSSKWLGMALHDPAVPGTFVVETALRRWLRAYGGLPHPNMLAGFLAAAMFFAIWLYQKTEHGFKKIFLPVIFVILSFGLFATFSKSVIGSFLVGLICLWILTFLKKWPSTSLPAGRQGSGHNIFPERAQRVEGLKIDLLKFTLIFLGVAAIFGATFWEPVQTRIFGMERLEVKSRTERLDYFGEAWQLIKNHPFGGVGPGNYTLAVHNEINSDRESWGYQPVHNIYLLILAELGIIGFVLWLALVFLIIKQLPVTRYPLLVTIMVIGLFDHYLWTLYFGVILFWLILGIEKSIDRPLDRQ